MAAQGPVEQAEEGPKVIAAGQWSKAIADSLGRRCGGGWCFARIGDDDPNKYFLSGTFTIDPAEDRVPPHKEHVWRGAIVLRAMRAGGVCQAR